MQRPSTAARRSRTTPSTPRREPGANRSTYTKRRACDAAFAAEWYARPHVGAGRKPEAFSKTDALLYRIEIDESPPKAVHVYFDALTTKKSLEFCPMAYKDIDSLKRK